MMSRLSTTEGSLRVANTEIARQDEVIKVLRRQLAMYEAAGPPALSGTDRERDLRRIRKLERTVHQMETFLADYGMIWVGDDDDDDESEGVGSSGDGTARAAAAPAVARGASPTSASVLAPASAAHSTATAVGGVRGAVTPSDYNKILEHVAELNALAGDGVGAVTRRPDGSVGIAMPDPVALRLYSNGIMLFDGPFRPLDEPVTQVTKSISVSIHFVSSHSQFILGGTLCFQHA
jgi:hypothetical protein